MNISLGKPCSHRGDELFDKSVVLLAPYALVMLAEIHRVIQEVFIVCATVNYHR